MGAAGFEPALERPGQWRVKSSRRFSSEAMLITVMEAASQQDDRYRQDGDQATVLLHSTATRGVELERLADLIAARIADGAASVSASALLTVREVLASRRGLTKSWLYANAAACGAIRKNNTRRSPLWFRLEDVDAELDRRRKAAMDRGQRTDGAPASALSAQPSRGRRPYSTANGSPRFFPVRPRVGPIDGRA
jgi:hypothetical protein